MPVFTSVGSLGTHAEWVESQDRLNFSFASEVPAGNLVVVWFACDNVFSVFSESGYGAQDHRFPLVDTKNNLWAFLGGKAGSNCWFLCSAYITIHCCQLTRTLTTGDVLSFAPWSGGVINAKAVSAWEFTVEEGYGWAVSDQDFNALEERPGNGAAIGWGTSQIREWLVVHGVAVEGPSTDTYTDPAGWTPIDSDGTNSGDAEEDITLHGAWRIETGNSFTADPALGTTRDLSQLIGGITPVRLPDTFPHTPIIDDFNRADEYPLDGGIWVAGTDDVDGVSGPEFAPNESLTTGPSSPGTRLLRIEGGEAAANLEAWPVGGAGGEGTVIIYECDDMEVYATWAGVDDLGWVQLLMHHQGSTNDANASGYAIAIRSANYFNVPPDSGLWALQLGHQGNQGVPHRTNLWFWIPPPVAPEPGWRFGIARFRGVNHAWVDTGDGWVWRGAYYTMNSNPGSGRLGLAIWDPLSRVDDFGGGPTCFIVNMNFRSASRHKEATRALQNPSDDPL